MWTCPKCGREFKKTNQDHYCGKAPETVDEYIALQTPKAQKHLAELRNVSENASPPQSTRYFLAKVCRNAWREVRSPPLVLLYFTMASLKAFSERKSPNSLQKR